MGASLALAGVTACTRQPAEKIVPYVRQPEELVPGKPLFFATAMTLGGVATGLLVESHEGRPTKIEGNPLHPGSLGATDVFAQAAILGLYDPDRVADAHQPRRDPPVVGVPRRDPRGARRRSSRSRAPASASSPSRSARRRSPRRFAICCARYPVGEVASVGSGQPRQRARGRAGSPSASTSTRSTASIRPTSSSRSTPTSSAAGPAALRYARDFAARRRPEAGRADEPALRGREHADARPARAPIIACRCRPSEIEPIARPIAAAVGVAGRRRRRRLLGPGRGARAASGSPRSRRICWRTAARAWSSPATASRRPSTRSRTR